MTGQPGHLHQLYLPQCPCEWLCQYHAHLSHLLPQVNL